MVDADFVHFEGLRERNMGCCMAVTDAAFVHLRGIRVLNMWSCNQLATSFAAFANLEIIHSLVIGACHNEGDDDDIQDDDAASEEDDAKDEAEEGRGMGLIHLPGLCVCFLLRNE